MNVRSFFPRGQAPATLPPIKVLSMEHSFTLEVSRAGRSGGGRKYTHPHSVQPPGRERLVRNRAAPSCGAPTPQATALPRYLVGSRVGR